MSMSDRVIESTEAYLWHEDITIPSGETEPAAGVKIDLNGARGMVVYTPKDWDGGAVTALVSMDGATWFQLMQDGAEWSVTPLTATTYGSAFEFPMPVGLGIRYVIFKCASAVSADRVIYLAAREA